MSTDTIEIHEIAIVLKCSQERVIKGLGSGELPGVKIGKNWVVPRPAFYQRLNEMAGDNRPLIFPASQPTLSRRKKLLTPTASLRDRTRAG